MKERKKERKNKDIKKSPKLENVLQKCRIVEKTHQVLLKLVSLYS
jgi:hypothetical protein